MKVHISVVITALLFSFGGAVARGQAAQENTATPRPRATPSNASSAKGQVDEPAQNGGSFETPSSAQAEARQQTVSANLEESVAGLTKAVTKLVEKQAEPENVRIKFVDFLTALIGLVGAIVILGSVVFGLHKTGWLEKNKQIIMPAFFAILLGFVLLGLVYLLSGAVTALLNVLIAIIILLIALSIAAVHLLTFIDEHPKLKRRIVGDSAESFDEGLASTLK